MTFIRANRIIEPLLHYLEKVLFKRENVINKLGGWRSKEIWQMQSQSLKPCEGGGSLHSERHSRTLLQLQQEPGGAPRLLPSSQDHVL